MPVTVVVGGQFGSEGKGKVAHALAREGLARVALRVGGPNSGHTVIGHDGKPVILRQLPTPAILPNVLCVLGAGSYIDTDILFDEMKQTRLPADRLIVDPNATIISEREKREEANSTLKQAIGSTLSGTGAAASRRVARLGAIQLAKNDPHLKPFLCSVPEFLRRRLDAGERLLLEGTQGFGLSLLHSPHYPFVTSRDTTAAGFLAESGLSPLDVDDVILVLRAFPIRVAGNSGPLPNEINWGIVTSESQSADPVCEYTSVTKSVRRVGRFDAELVKQAIVTNSPTHIVLNHLDYVDWSCRHSSRLSFKATKFVQLVESSITRKISYLGFGPASLITP